MFRNLIFGLAFLTTSLIGASFDDGANAFYKRDYKTAFSIFEDFAKQGDISAQYNLGLIYQNGFGVKQDYLIAKDWYEKAAIKRHAWAQYNLGNMYFSGHGVKNDYKKAIKWYEKSAIQGDTLAQNTLGDIYFHGYGVEQDYKKAIEWFSKSCDGVYQEGCDNYENLNQKNIKESED